MMAPPAGCATPCGTRPEPQASRTADDVVAAAVLLDVSKGLVGRLDGVREMIARQGEPFAVDGEIPPPVARRDRLMVGGQILRVCADYVTLQDHGMTPADALARLGQQAREYDPQIVATLARSVQTLVLK
jgi:hypothetical protein